MNIEEIANSTGASLISKGPESEILDISIDSRSAKGLTHELFIAISGPNHNAHDYIIELANRGIRNFIVEEAVDPIADCNILRVESSVAALQALAKTKRMAFSKKVIGITGSNGKTIVKEWLSTILSISHDVIKSPKSYNSQIGVPLSVWPLSDKHEVGVFEAGISKPEEMAKLASILSPSLGIFTNIGTAHDEYFDSTAQKITEKLKLFQDSQQLIYRADHAELALSVEAQFNGEKLSWSTNPEYDAEFKVDMLKPKEIKVTKKTTEHTFRVDFKDDASLENITHCIVAAMAMGVSQTEIQKGISMISPVKMRLELKKGINNTYLIDDTYNNDIAGLTKALDFMDQQQQMTKRSLILSDFIQSKSAADFYEELNQLLTQKGIDKLIAIGPQLTANQTSFGIPSSFYDSIDAFLSSKDVHQFKDELILIKGARQFKFERISRVLEDKGHKTILEINLDAITHNLNYYKAQLHTETKIMVVVKALAYGAGSSEISKLLEFHKVDYLAVAYADEGVALRQNGIELPIMVMNASEHDPFNLIPFNLEPEIYSLPQLESFIEAYSLSDKVLPAHLILNTGMNRLGFNEEDMDALIKKLSTNSNIQVKSIFTHLAASEEEAHETFTAEQVNSFRALADRLEGALGYKPIRHVLNSGGITRHNQFQEDMVRLGIGLHGVEVSKLHAEKLENTATLKTVISQVRQVPKGQTIGYGRKGLAQADMTIATIAIGYADGYLRHFGNGKAYVMVNGMKARTIGNICMDMAMIDVSGIEANVGDEVIVFGNNPTVSQLAEWGDTIPYEILTNVSNRVKRVFYSE